MGNRELPKFSIRTGGNTRKPRIIIIDDDPLILGLLTNFFSLKHYEVTSFREPILCTPSNKTGDCLTACADIMITDFRMPRINGIELLTHQSGKGCAIDINNKAVVSANLREVPPDKIGKLAGTFFEKPCSLKELYAWTQECVRRADLSQPLGNYFGEGQ